MEPLFRFKHFALLSMASDPFDVYEIILYSHLFSWKFISLDSIYWIDLCQNDGNLLATAGNKDKVKGLDKRESKIIQLMTFSMVIIFDF